MTSTINPANPATGSGMLSAVIRANFAAAAHDIQRLQQMYGGTSAPSGPESGQDFLDQSAVPWTWKKYDGAAWVELGLIDPTDHTVSNTVKELFLSGKTDTAQSWGGASGAVNTFAAPGGWFEREVTVQTDSLGHTAKTWMVQFTGLDNAATSGGIDEYGQLILGDLFGSYPWLYEAGQSWSLAGTSGDGHNGAPLGRIKGDLAVGDLLCFGGADSQGIQGQQIGRMITGAFPSFVSLNCSEYDTRDTSPVDARITEIGGAFIQVYPASTASAGPGPLTAALLPAITATGSGYAVGEMITAAGGTHSKAAQIRVRSVNGSGGVTAADIRVGGIYTIAPVAGALTQASTTGTGTGATFTATFQAPPNLGYEGAVNIIAYNPDGAQNIYFRGRSAANLLAELARVTDTGMAIGAPTTMGAGTLNLQGDLFDDEQGPTGTAGSGYVRANSPIVTGAMNLGSLGAAGGVAGVLAFGGISGTVDGFQIGNNFAGGLGSVSALKIYPVSTTSGYSQMDGAGNWSFGAALTLRAVISPTTLSGNVNDYNPTGLANAQTVRINGGASDRNITGLAGGAEGRVLTIVNVGTTNNLTLTNQDAGSGAANQFLLTANKVLAPNVAFTLRYDGTTGAWRPLVG